MSFKKSGEGSAFSGFFVYLRAEDCFISTVSLIIDVSKDPFWSEDLLFLSFLKILITTCFPIDGQGPGFPDGADGAAHHGVNIGPQKYKLPPILFFLTFNHLRW